MKFASIYCLIDPLTDEVRYVGKTVTPLINRLKQHLGNVNFELTDKDKWINSLLRIGSMPVIKEVIKVDNDEWEYWEKYYIKKYRDEGSNLLNIHEGGQLMKNQNS